MKTGTRSLLFGVHNIIWHPITVALAWRELYGKWPSFWEGVAIFVHDLGYWGLDNLDDAEGEKHPIFGANLIRNLYIRTHEFSTGSVGCAQQLYMLVRHHSRFLSARDGATPSRLAWADKLSMTYDPTWWYLLRGHASGEIEQYRASAAHIIPLAASDYRWFVWCRAKCAADARLRRATKPRDFRKPQPE